MRTALEIMNNQELAETEIKEICKKTNLDISLKTLGYQRYANFKTIVAFFYNEKEEDGNKNSLMVDFLNLKKSKAGLTEVIDKLSMVRNKFYDIYMNFEVAWHQINSQVKTLENINLLYGIGDSMTEMWIKNNLEDIDSIWDCIKQNLVDIPDSADFSQAFFSTEDIGGLIQANRDYFTSEQAASSGEKSKIKEVPPEVKEAQRVRRNENNRRWYHKSRKRKMQQPPDGSDQVLNGPDLNDSDKHVSKAKRAKKAGSDVAASAGADHSTDFASAPFELTDEQTNILSEIFSLHNALTNAADQFPGAIQAPEASLSSEENLEMLLQIAARNAAEIDQPSSSAVPASRASSKLDQVRNARHSSNKE